VQRRVAALLTGDEKGPDHAYSEFLVTVHVS